VHRSDGNIKKYICFLLQEEEALKTYFAKDVRKVVYMKECEWTEYKKNNAVAIEALWLSSEVEKNRPMSRLVPRATVRGGMIETFKLKFDLKDNPDYKLYFVDINSLYSKVCLENSFGLGPYKIIIDKKDLNANIRWTGTEFKYRNESMKSDVCHVTWLAPSNLTKPFLPFRINDEFNFLALCRTCVLNKITKTCPHKSDDMRSFTSCYTVSEINYAKLLGYEILSWHEVHHYSQESPFLSEFVKILGAEKLRNSNILANVPESEQNNFCDNLNSAMKFDSAYKLTPETICDNLFQKQFYKDMQNSFFGRFALKNHYNSFFFCKTLREIENYANKDNTELVNILPISENICQIEIAQSQKSKVNLNGSLYITSQINSLARQYLYDQIIKVEQANGIVLSCDTDSIIFALKKDVQNPLDISPEIGSFKDVLPGCEIISFYSLNPRNYSILYKNENNKLCHQLKVKGLSLKSENCLQSISHENYALFVDQNFTSNIETIYIPQMKKKFNKNSKTFTEILSGFTFSSETHVKRYLPQSDNLQYQTYPYGFKYVFSNNV
jgi:hypothetical protein